MALTNVPSLREKSTEEQVLKIHKYLISLKNDLEYELQNVSASSGGGGDVDLEGLMQILDFDKTDIDEWNKIKEITDNLGNVIAEKLKGSIDTSITKILNTTATVVFDENGIFIHDQPEEKDSNWAMRIGAAGFMIAKEKIIHEDIESFEWNWTTFGTGEGFTADCIIAGELNALTLNACNLLATNITSGSIKGVNMSSCNLDAVNIEASTIEATEINGCDFYGNTFTGNTFEGGEFNGAEMNTSTLNAATINASTFNTSTFSAGTIETSTLNSCQINTGVLRGNEIYGGLISGAVVQSLGTYGDGVMLKDLGYAVYAPTPDKTGIVAGLMMYDQNGAGTNEEAQNRVLFGTQNDYALKIHSAADMSITAEGEIFLGDVRFMGTTNLGLFLKNKIVWVDDGCIIDDKYYMKITDTAITLLNTGEKLVISSQTGSIESLYNANKGNL